MALESFIGEISIVAFDYPPQGWKICNGEELQISQYVVLFSLIGNTYGGDGHTTFRLPNLVGRMPRGGGQSQLFNTEFCPLGEAGGRTSVILTPENLPIHSHNIRQENAKVNVQVQGTATVIPWATKQNGNTNDPTHAMWANTEDGSNNPLKNFYKPTSNPPEPKEGMLAIPGDIFATATAVVSGRTEDVGVSKQVLIMNPYLNLNFIICVEGIYPSRP